MTEEQRRDKIAGVHMIMVAAMLADYGGRMLIDGAKFALKNHVNGIMNHAGAVERVFVASSLLTEVERLNFKKQFSGSNAALIAEHLQNLFGLDEDSLELVIKHVESIITKKAPTESGL